MEFLMYLYVLIGVLGYYSTESRQYIDLFLLDIVKWIFYPIIFVVISLICIQTQYNINREKEIKGDSDRLKYFPHVWDTFKKFMLN